MLTNLHPHTHFDVISVHVKLYILFHHLLLPSFKTRLQWRQRALSGSINDYEAPQFMPSNPQHINHGLKEDADLPHT